MPAVYPSDRPHEARCAIFGSSVGYPCDVDDPGLCERSALELRAGYLAREFTPAEVVEALAARVAERDPVVNAFTTLALDTACEEAARAGEAYARGDAGPLAGVPVAVKDLIDTAGLRTTYGSAIHADHVPAADADVVARVRAAGAVVIGKTTTHEFAWGITSDNPHQGPCRNPWDSSRVAGGSSGGSAAALACGDAPLALGSDTGGSIRIPAAFCGVVGLKPTFGRVSTAGVFALAPSLDHVGPLARTAADARLLLDVVALDPVARAPVSLHGLRVGVSADLEPVGLHPAVARARDAALAALGAMGARVVEVAIPGGLDAYAIFSPIQLAEALGVHRRAGLFPEHADRYGADVRARLEAAEGVGLAAYLEAGDRRRQLGEAFAAAFAHADVLLTPISAGPPVRVGEHQTEHLGRRIAFRELVMGSTVPQDLTGLPACAVPAGFDDDGLPIGVQVTGPWREEHRVLCVAEALDAVSSVPRIAPAPGA